MPRFMKLAGIAALAALLCTAPASAAIRVEPMSYDLTPNGTGARRDLRVENSGDRPTAVELRVERREILPDGSERRTPADDDFLLFPPQGIVPANGFQTFRVQYIGQPVARTVLYSVIVAQQPVDTERGRVSGVQFLFSLGTLAAVSPERSAADLVIESVIPAGPGLLRITVMNRGNRYARLRTGRWVLTAANGATETLEDEPLRRQMRQGLIEAGARRVFDLPVSSAFVREGAQARYEQTPAR